MGNYAAVMDASACINCARCTVSCKDQFALNDYPPHSAGTPFRGQNWIRVEEVIRGTWPKTKFTAIPILCQHCDNPPCMVAAKDGAIYKRDDGIVIIDPVKSKGQKQIVDSCPYGVIFWNEEKEIPQKCTFCVHRLEKGEVPRCMQTCPSGAINIGDYGELIDVIRSKDARTFHPEYAAAPRVYYIGLPRTFITGAVVDTEGECVGGADVSARDTETGRMLSTKSEFTGDFCIDELDAKRTYEVTVSKAGKTKTMTVSLDKDTDLGDITL